MLASRCEKEVKSILEVVSELLDGKELPSNLPSGVEKVERVTSEAIRIELADQVDYDLLYRVAAEEGYGIKAGGFAPRVVDKGRIVARVGSESDPGGRRDIFIYLLPPTADEMSMYTRAIAIRDGVLNAETGKINSERFYQYNLRVVRLVENYRKVKYHRLMRKQKL